MRLYGYNRVWLTANTQGVTMRSLLIVLGLVVVANSGPLARGQDLPPQITGVTYYVNGVEIAVAEPFAGVIEVLEGDLVRIEIAVTLVLDEEQTEVEEIELFYQMASYWMPYSYYYAPEGPPLRTNTGWNNYRRASFAVIADNEYLVIVEFRVPLFNGPNQARLAGLINYDVQWNSFIRIWTSDTVDEQDAGLPPGFLLQIFATENPDLRPENDPPPFADAGGSSTVQVGSTVILDGSMTHDGFNIGFNPLLPSVYYKNELVYAWEWMDGPQYVAPEYPDPDSAPWLATALLPVTGVYRFRLFVFDGVNPWGSEDVAIVNVVDSIAANRPPRALAAAPTAPVVVGDTITLSAADSTDPPHDPACDDCNFRWRQVDEVGGAIPFDEFTQAFLPVSGLEARESTLQALRPGTYYFRLIVDDGELWNSTIVTVEVISAETAGLMVNGQTRDDALLTGGALLPGAGCTPGLLPLLTIMLGLCLLRVRSR